MSVHRWRRWTVVVVLLVGIGGCVAWVSTRDVKVVEIDIFEVAEPLCRVAPEQTLGDDVAGVAAERDDMDLRRAMAQARAGIWRQYADADDTPAAVRGDLNRLADQLIRAAESGDFSATERAAAALDEKVRKACA